MLEMKNTVKEIKNVFVGLINISVRDEERTSELNIRQYKFPSWKEKGILYPKPIPAIFFYINLFISHLDRCNDLFLVTDTTNSFSTLLVWSFLKANQTTSLSSSKFLPLPLSIAVLEV